MRPHASYYEATARRPAVRARLAGSSRCDVCVVGGGYAGLSAALELGARGLHVVLLEARELGWAASGRNGGQLLPGFGLEGDATIASSLSEAQEREAWRVTTDAMELVRARIRDHGIACDWQPGCLTLAVRPRKAARLRRWFERVSNVHDYPLQWIGREEVGRWVGSTRYCAGVFDAAAGHLHPLKYCLGLADAAEAAGVCIHERTRVVAVDRGAEAVVRAASGAQLHCRFVVLAEGADPGASFAPELGSRVLPVRTFMIATQRMPPDVASSLLPSRAAVSDSNFDLDYFRLSADDRLLFGGGDTVVGEEPPDAASRIRRRMLAVFPQLRALAVEFDWAGIVDLTLNRVPDFGRLAPNVYYVQGFSGHGVAMAGMAGLLAAEAVAGQAGRFDLFASIAHARVPRAGVVRAPALVLGSWIYRLRDRL